MTNLQKMRERRHLKQHELAQLSGVTQQAISMIENGDRKNPGVITMLKLAKALRCMIEDLIEEDK